MVVNLYAPIMVNPPLHKLSFVKPDVANLKATNESYAALFPAEPLKAFQESPVSDVERETSVVP
jgi:hypothetical protein